MPHTLAVKSPVHDVSAPFDLAIIGAGVAGAAVAHGAQERHPEWRSLLLEQSARIGGRLLSLTWPGIGSVRAELGGMRYRTSQPLITGLVTELGLQTRPFLTTFDDNRFALRGATWRAGDPSRASGPYALEEDERGCSPAELLLRAFERIVPGALDLTEFDWTAAKADEFRGRPLRDWSLHDALAAVLSADGHRYVVDGFGYSDLLGDRSAAEAIPWVLIETRPELENHTIADGMEALPQALVARFVAAGGTLRLDCAATAVTLTHDGSAPFRVEAADGRAWSTRRLVIAVPPRAIGKLSRRSPLLGDRRVASLTGSVTATPAAKLFLAYERAWWRDAGFRGVRIVSDGPLSKTYAFDFNVAPDARATGPALLLASYSDGPHRDRWVALHDRQVRRDAGDGEARSRWAAYAASADQVSLAQQCLAAVFEGAVVPAPLAAAFKDWTDGAWHTWNVSARSADVMASAAQPFESLPLYLANESWSLSQGWIEGALESAERAIDRIG